MCGTAHIFKESTCLLLRQSNVQLNNSVFILWDKSADHCLTAYVKEIQEYCNIQKSKEQL